MRRTLESTWLSRTHELPTMSARPEISSSWRRSERHVSTETSCAPMKSPPEVSERFGDSRFGRACRVIEQDLRDIVDGGDMVAALTDQSVTITWMVGGRRMLRNAEKVHFVVGGQWSEDAVGTNALALAEKLDRPMMVFSAEHFLPVVHDWVCYSAPVLDPRTGEFQGVIDISSLWSKTNPSLLTTVRALARCVQYELQNIEHVPSLDCASASRLEVRTLGPTELKVNNLPIRVTRRQLEIVAVLALYPAGLSLDELTTHVYGEHSVSPATVKAELSHLRSKLGGVIGSRPYRLIGDVDADHVRVLHSLARNDLAGALDTYRGSMMPNSESPVIETCRHQIDVALRGAVVASRDPDLLFRLSMNCPDDHFLLKTTLAALDTHDLRTSLIAGLLERN